VLYYLKRDSKLDYLDYDIQSITPGDYSVEMKIEGSAYEWFLHNIYPEDKRNNISPGYSLKKYIKHEIEKILNEELADLRRNGDPEENKSIKISEVKIADIVFAFNNS
jgi:hypothetical protein